MANEGTKDRPGEIHRINQLPKAIKITGTTDGSGNFNSVHSLNDYTTIMGITATVNHAGSQMRDPVGWGGQLYADTTTVYLIGSLGGSWANQKINMIVFYT